MAKIYTVGHSSHTAEHFLALLSQHGIQALVDTRSAPYSRYSPQFDRESLKEAVLATGVKYLWLGDVVGGRPKNESCYDAEGRVLYSRVAMQTEFREAIERLKRGADEFRVALLCSEEDPAHCHRRLLVSRVLLGEGVEIAHIRGDGSLDKDDDVARKSGKLLIENQPALFGELDDANWRSTGVIGKKATHQDRALTKSNPQKVCQVCWTPSRVSSTVKHRPCHRKRHRLSPGCTPLKTAFWGYFFGSSEC